VNYSLFIMLLKEMELKGQPGLALAMSPLLSSQSTNLFGVFCARHEITQGVLFIVGFWSNQDVGEKYCFERMHKAQDGPHHVARVVAYMVGPLLCLIAFPIDLFFSSSCISPKKDVAKD
jgi:hypothetical protein